MKFEQKRVIVNPVKISLEDEEVVILDNLLKAEGDINAILSNQKEIIVGLCENRGAVIEAKDLDCFWGGVERICQKLKDYPDYIDALRLFIDVSNNFSTEVQF